MSKDINSLQELNGNDFNNRYTFLLEMEQINPHKGKCSNRHGNNGGTYQSGRIPTRWKTIKFIENATKEEAIIIFSAFKIPGFMIINNDTNEVVFDGGSKF